jgi:hypothetical protein
LKAVFNSRGSLMGVIGVFILKDFQAFLLLLK